MASRLHHSTRIVFAHRNCMVHRSSKSISDRVSLALVAHTLTDLLWRGQIGWF